MSTTNLTPLLQPPPPETTARATRFRQAARIIHRASTMRVSEQSVTVRETAAREIEDRQIDWAYSRPVVILDCAWNTVFIAVALLALFVTRGDFVILPLRFWIGGYALQCFLHVFCVLFEFRRRRTDDLALESSALIRHLESANTMFSFIWWILGFYWIFVGGPALQQDCPVLYWLCVAFLILDLFFVIFCLVLASLVAAAVCCCLPCIIAILHVFADRVGASKEDIEVLSMYKFHRFDGDAKVNVESEAPCEGIMKECGTDSPIERRLTAEDAECCICLSAYEDSVELRELPCGHHFHCTCVDKWLYINSTCPLCKYDISRQCSRDGEV